VAEVRRSHLCRSHLWWLKSWSQLVNQLAVTSRNTKRDFLDAVRHFDAHGVRIKLVVGEWVAIHVHA
jgi:hypothetical protein